MCSVLLGVSIGMLDESFHVFLRIAITIVALDIIITDYDRGTGLWAFLFVFVLIVFNPVFPVDFSSSAVRFVFCSLSSFFFAVRAITYQPVKKAKHRI